ncbi:exopolysaccharide biosynthesis polyprenyl glycosylphosphotransferase [Candidatus Hydrogenedentota bacterium]
MPKKQHLLNTALLLALCEAACIIAAVLVAQTLARWPYLPFWKAVRAQAQWPVVLLVTWYLLAMNRRLYTSRRNNLFIPQLIDVARAMFSAALVTLFFMAILKPDGVERRFALVFCVSAIFLVLLFRLMARLSIWGLRGKGFSTFRIVLIGSNPRTRRLVESMLSREHYGYQVLGVLDDDPSRGTFLEGFDIPYLGKVKTLEEMLSEDVVDMVYVTLPLRSHYEIVQDIAHLCEGIGVGVRLAGDVFSTETTTCEATHLGDILLLDFSSRVFAERFGLNRMSDWLVHAFLLIFLSPIIGIIALLTKLESRGPVFVIEPHFDLKNRRQVPLLRFRTTRSTNPQAGETDARTLSHVGAFVEEYSLHQIPQIMNVLKGHTELYAAKLIPIREDSPIPDTSSEDTESETTDTVVDAETQLSLFLTFLVLLDFMSFGVAFLWAAWDTLPWDLAYARHLSRHAPYLIVFAILWYAAANDQRLFSRWRMAQLQAHIFAMIKAVGISLIIGTVIVGISLKGAVDNHFLLEFCLVAPVILFIMRLCFRFLDQSLHRHGLYSRSALIVGANERAIHLAHLLTSAHDRGCVAREFLEDNEDRRHLLEEIGLTWSGGMERLGALLTSGSIHAVYVCLPIRSFYEHTQEMLRLCEEGGVSMTVLADMFHTRVASSRLMHVDDMPVISLSSISENYMGLFVKRVIDLTVATLILLLLLPVFAVIAVLIKLDSKGPVFFKQERVGQNQRSFGMLKFRTMVVDAEKLREELEVLNEASGPVFKIKDDPRITRIGKFMRKHSVDEFPQLINVWLGEMSLVGPRPPIQSEVVQYTWSQRRRLSIRPGMTGLWQVSGRSGLGFDEWVELDLRYIDTWSIWLDFLILVRTFKEVIGGRGAA